MFDALEIADLDATAACQAVEATQAALREQEWRELALAEHWAVLHGPESLPSPEASPGGERLRQVGGDGTPDVAEFACAELGLLMGVGFIAASTLMRDAVDLRHRHPRMWSALRAGRARVWKARKVSQLVHAAGLSLDQARFVDEATTEYVDALTWSAFTRLVGAKIIEADPAAADARREAAALARFVATGQSDEHGLRTLAARAHAGEVVYFVAMCDRLAQILELRGDTDPVDVRRSKALAILANPAGALALLEEHATDEPHPDDPDRSPVEVPARANTCTSCGGPRIDPEKLRPRAILHVRISELALDARAGVAAVDAGVGPVSVQAVAGPARAPPGQRSPGGRPARQRPGRRLRGAPRDAGGAAAGAAVEHPSLVAHRLEQPGLGPHPLLRPGSRRPDPDHEPRAARPVRSSGQDVGRGWQLRQPTAGVYLWRTPHGYWFRVDNDGTHPLGRDPDLTAHDSPDARSSMEHALADLVASS